MKDNEDMLKLWGELAGGKIRPPVVVTPDGTFHLVKGRWIKGQWVDSYYKKEGEE